MQPSFNYPVQPAELQSLLSVSVQEAGKQAVPYRYAISRIKEENDFNVLVTIDGKIPFNATVTIAAKRRTAPSPQRNTIRSSRLPAKAQLFIIATTAIQTR